MIEGAIIALVGAAIGWWARGRSGKSLLQVERRPPRAMCSCNDPYGMHHPKTGKCLAQKLMTYNDMGMKMLKPCPCARYDGPKPLTEYIAEEYGIEGS